jgi:hypothetical protein
MEGSNRSDATRAYIKYNQYVLLTCVSSPGVPSLGRSALLRLGSPQSAGASPLPPLWVNEPVSLLRRSPSRV